MRVSQLQNLTWAGNVLVLAGVAWVGVQFWDARKPAAAKELKWDTMKAGTDAPRWPGDLSAFSQIWTTPINGKVPPPPPPPTTVVQKVDKVAEFKSKLKYSGGMEYPGQPELCTARVNFEGKDLSICPGSSVGGFQLLQFWTTTDVATNERLAHLVFRNPENGTPFTVDQVASQGQPLSDTKNPLVNPQYGNGIQPGAVPEKGPLDTTSFIDPATGDCVITWHELAWITLYGEKNLWPNLATKPDVDPQGVSHGVKILSPLESAPLAPSHGIGVGDVVRSINGEPMTSKEDIVGYLHGKGKGLAKYDVVVDTGGKERTVVYRVPRRP